MRSQSRSEHGFSLIEVLIASLLAASALAGLAQLVAIGVTQATVVRDEAAAQALAQSTIDVLRGEPWTYDAGGARLSSPDLAESPAGSLLDDRPGYVEALDAFGEVLDEPDAETAAYRRRWSVTRFQPGDQDTVVLRACVWTVARSPGAVRQLPDACVSTIRTRKP